jgi:erythronate-4-phosphate dehydrogenase
VNILYDRNMVLGEALFSRLGKAKAIEGRSLTAKDLAKTDLLFIRSTCRVTKELLSKTKLRFIGSGVVGTDHIDFEAARCKGIRVEAAPGCNAESVADYVIAALLVIGERQKRSWQGATLGIVGVGHVGRIVWKFAEEALGMKVIGCDPPRQDQGDFMARNFVSYEQILEQADVITFHVPLNVEGPYKTVGMFAGPIVRKVKPGAVLLNFARGPVCDNALVATMLGAGLLSDAAIDCWEGEPNYSPDLAAIAALTTPHIAGHAYEGKANGTVAVYEAACEFLGIEPGEIPAFPPAPVPTLKIDGANLTDEEVLRIAVRATCDIEGDTARFRAAFDGDVERRKANFDALRKNYPFRRLFSATEIILSNPSDTIVTRLSALGFSVQIVEAPKKVKAKKAPAKAKTVKKAKPIAKVKTAKKANPVTKAKPAKAVKKPAKVKKVVTKKVTKKRVEEISPKPLKTTKKSKKTAKTTKTTRKQAVTSVKTTKKPTPVVKSTTRTKTKVKTTKGKKPATKRKPVLSRTQKA